MSLNAKRFFAETCLYSASGAATAAAFDVACSLRARPDALRNGWLVLQLVGWEFVALIGPLCLLLWGAAALLGRSRAFGEASVRGAWLGISISFATFLVLSTWQALTRLGVTLGGVVLWRLLVVLLAVCWWWLPVARLGARLRRARLVFGLGAVALPLVGLGVLPVAWARLYPGRPALAPRGDHAGQARGVPQAVVLVTIDSLRPDFLSVYNPQVAYMPGTEALSRDATVYEQAVSVAPWTKPALGSILTGLDPDVHGVRRVEDSLAAGFDTLAEQFYAAGYRTGLIGVSPYLDPAHGFGQGFVDQLAVSLGGLGRSFAAELVERFGLPTSHQVMDTSGITRRATAWITQHHRTPFFLWLHYYDPHQPYEPPDEFMPKGAPPAHDLRHFRSFKQVRGGYRVLSAAEREWIRGLYAGEVRYVDAQLERLLSVLKALHLYENALIIVASDHGEEFWEHGGFEHGHALYDEVLRVPLLVKYPGHRTARRERQRVPLTAIYTTLMEAIERRANDGHARAPSLASIPFSEAFSSPLFSQAVLYYEPKIAVTRAGKKLIRSQVTGQEQLFDLVTDPRETAPLPLDGSLAEGLRALVIDRFETARHAQPTLRSRAAPSPDDATEDNLRALGYIE